jgi:hypothetical protein
VRITRAKTTDQLWNEYSKHPNLWNWMVKLLSNH